MNNSEICIYKRLKILLTHTIDYIRYKNWSNNCPNMFKFHKVIEQIKTKLLSERHDIKPIVSSSEVN